MSASCRRHTFFQSGPDYRAASLRKLGRMSSASSSTNCLPCKDAWGGPPSAAAPPRYSSGRSGSPAAAWPPRRHRRHADHLSSSRLRARFPERGTQPRPCPRGAARFVTQRSRWCLGAMQQLYTRWSFAGSAHIGLVNRLSSFDVTLFWIFGASFRLMMLSAPLVYWWTGICVINGSANDMVYWLGPYPAGQNDVRGLPGFEYDFPDHH